MITLVTLQLATEQEVFDQVANHLLTQKRVSRDSHGKCKYRYHGLKCAAGCLIGDAEYHRSMEDSSWGIVVDKFQHKYPKVFTHEDLIFRLQMIHDNTDPRVWLETLRQFAIGYELTTAVLEKYQSPSS